MALLGIDYGTKKVGLAVSDVTESMAFPLGVFPNNQMLLGEISKLCIERGISGVVIGESKNLKWQDNPVMKQIYAFAEEIKKTLALTVSFEPEYFTTAEARRGSEGERVDASAAALILQSFLDKRHHGTK